MDVMYGDDLKQIGRNMKKASYLILGDIMLDRYISGDVERVSPESPIPVVYVRETRECLGGAANVAQNLRHFDSSVYLVSAVGIDDRAKTIEVNLKNEKILYYGLESASRITTLKTRIIGKCQQIVRFDEEIDSLLDEKDETLILNRLMPLIRQVDLIILSDYAKGVCTPKLCSALIAEAKLYKVKVVVDPKGTEWDKYRGSYVITPNWKEFTKMVGAVEAADDKEICKRARTLMEEYEVENILITRSEQGMTLVSKEKYLSFKAEAREVADVSGAGDTAIAALAAFLGVGVQLEKAVYWANRAAGLAVERAGTSVIGIEQLIQNYYEESVQTDFSKKIINMESLKRQLLSLRDEQKKIVFTNGCFDILHMGHIQYLNEAKKLGDFLIVAVNTDQSVRRLRKGKKRPINREIDRAMQLAALQMVDAVILFDEDTPLEVLWQIRPDILVKGGDYQLEEIVGKEYAKETRVLSLKEGYSTTCLIEKIQCDV